MDKDEALFGIGDDLAHTLIARIIQTPSSGHLRYKRGMLFFFLKAFKTYGAAAVLWRAGFVEDTCVLARAVYELRLQALYLSADPEPRATLFIRHWYQVGWGTLQKLKKKGDEKRKGLLEIGENVMRDAILEAGFPDLLEDTQAAEKAIEKKWWDKGIKGLVKDLAIEQEYDVIYSQLSDYTHSGAHYPYVRSASVGN